MKSDESETLATQFGRSDRLGVPLDESGERGREESGLLSHGPNRKRAKIIDESQVGNYN